MPEEMNAYEAERAARIEANRERMRALGLAEGGALRVGGLGESEAEYLDAPGAGLALGARPKPRKVGKASSAGKRAREPAAPSSPGCNAPEPSREAPASDPDCPRAPPPGDARSGVTFSANF